MSEKFKLEYCNLAKTCAMILVVVYHCLVFWTGEWFKEPVYSCTFFAYLAQWLNTFHIYVFVFISGYLFYFTRYEQKKYSSSTKYLLSKMKRLIYPYLIMLLLWGIPFFILCTGRKNEIIEKFFYGKSLAQYWFLLMLFWVYCIFYFISDYVKERWLLGLVVFYVIYGIATIVMTKIPNYFQILSALKYLLFFYVGMVYRKNTFDSLCKIPCCVWMLTSIILFLGWYFLDFINLFFAKIVRIAIYPFISISGVFMVIKGICMINVKKLQENKLYCFLEKYNFAIYLFHQQMVYISILWFNGKVNNIVVLLFNFLFAMVGGIIAYGFCKLAWIRKMLQVN